MKTSLYQLLRKRYPANEYALMAEVRDKAGFDASRSADYVAVNLWPSRGLAVEGIEVKSYRGDWLGELKKPAKAENIFQYCDFFWLLTTEKDVAKLEEIPLTWGWLEVVGEKIVKRKDAPSLQPKPLTRHFTCAMLKRAVDKTDFIHKDEIEDTITARVESKRTSVDYELQRSKQRVDELTKMISEFHEASGIDLQQYSWRGRVEHIGKAVKLVENQGIDDFVRQLKALEKQSKNIHEQISNTLKNIKDEITVTL